MDFTLTDQQRQFQQRAREFAERRIKPIAAELDRQGRFPAELLQEAGQLGFLGVQIEREYGGSAAGAVAYSLMITEISKACAGTAVCIAVNNLSAEAIASFGNPAQKQKFLPRLSSSEATIGAFCLSESSSASDAGHMAARAERQGGDYVLTGEKMWITNGAEAGVFVVMAATERGQGAKGVSAFILEKGMPGLAVGKQEHKMGIRASNTVSIILDGVKVPAENRLGPEGAGFKVAMKGLDGGRIGVASQALGIGLAALDEGRKWASEHRRNGQPLADDPLVRQILADADLELEAGRLLTLQAASMRDAGIPFTKEASMAKVYVSEAANRAVQAMLDLHGRAGCTAGPAIEKLFRDVRVTTIYEGTSEIQRLVIARHLLRD